MCSSGWIVIKYIRVWMIAFTHIPNESPCLVVEVVVVVLVGCCVCGCCCGGCCSVVVVVLVR